ncbi:APC family permease [Pseudonocardia broussonetiae]|uniref:APC family permease n=1 Tax=Pseudonocardia broussonetiae TaxID=2736640 RepID=A0A6M6JNX3_9PSEU|nr:APC family permease [Pseudonocardia broussonetiae]QJY48001.1 APC family permease [Pseudonocardia broussonetiae]
MATSDVAGARTASGARSSRLRPNSVGVLGILFFVLSAQAPLTGIAGATPLTVALGNGAGAPGAYLLVGLMIIIFAVGFIAMSRYVTDAGAFYAYVGRGLGRPTGTGSALTALWSYATVQACMYGLYGAVVSSLVGTYGGVSVPWWVCAVVTMIVIQVVGALGIDTGARVLGVLVALEMSILIAFALGVLFQGGGPEGLAPAASFAPSAVFAGAPGVAIMFAVASMFGFESTAIYSEEAKDPERTVPRATYLSVTLIAVFFAFVTWMLVSFYGPADAAAAAGAALDSGDSTSFLTGAIGTVLGGWTGDVVGFLLASSLLAGILAFHNAINRYLYSLGRHGSLPQALTRVNGRGAPAVAGTVQTAIALVLVVPFAVLGLDPVLTLFSWLSGVAVLALMLLYFLTSVSVVVFFRRRGATDAGLWRTFLAPTVSALLTLGTGVLIVANFTTLIGGEAGTALWLMATVPLVFVVGVVLDAATRRNAG